MVVKLDIIVRFIKTYIMNTMIDYVEETMKEKFDLVKTIKYSKEEY